VDQRGPRPHWDVAVDAAIKVATIGLLAWAVLNPGLPQFSDKAFMGRAIAYPIALSAIPVGWWLLGRRIPFPTAADILFGLPFLIDVVGNALNLYDSIEWWDDANHLVNWLLHTGAVGLLLRHGSWGAGTRLALAFGYAVTSAVAWELAEFVTFVPNSPEAASAYADTLLDLALGMVGGLIAAIVTSRLPSLRSGTEPKSAVAAGLGDEA
jgi:hypothetical protein